MQYKQSYIYILTNKNNTVLYTGVTSDLKRRVYEHKQKFVKGFTSKYNVDKLVYFEVFDDVYNAITREKQIKGGSRQKKIDLINSMNETWKDLYDEIWNANHKQSRASESVKVKLFPVVASDWKERSNLPAK